nr:uncharacterized protein LOC127316287 [Lolium perenne]
MSEASSNRFLHLHPYNLKTETIDSLRNPSIAIRKNSIGGLPRSRAHDGWPADSRASLRLAGGFPRLAPAALTRPRPQLRAPPALRCPLAGGPPAPRELAFRAGGLELLAPAASRSSHRRPPAPLAGGSRCPHELGFRRRPRAPRSGGLAPIAPAAPDALKSSPSAPAALRPSRRWPCAPHAGGSRCPPKLAFHASRGSPELASTFSHASSSRRPAPPGLLLLRPWRP